MKYVIALIAVFVCSQTIAADPPVQRLLIVEEAQQADANAAAIEVFGPKAADTFSVLYTDGTKNYYVACWRVGESRFGLLRAALNRIDGPKPQIYVQTPANPNAGQFANARGKLKEKNLKPVTTD